jgi:vacuolar protein sorting-associated protein 45
MSIVEVVHDNILSVLRRISGMKVLLVDSETIGIVSLVLSQSQILELEVFLVEVVENQSERDFGTDKAVQSMRHLKAVSFLRPTSANFLFLTRELKFPRFSTYHLFFTNIVQHTRLEQIAGCDEMELVQEVHELFLDYFAINADLFSLNIPATVSLTSESSMWTSYEDSILTRIVDGIFAAAVSSGMYPFIRYPQPSSLCLRIGQLLQAKIDEEFAIFENMGNVPPSIILLYDRRADAVTPLLNQWTYQAMCHELIGIENNRIELGKNSSTSSHVLSSFQDTFFSDHLTSNFGDLALAVQRLVKQFQDAQSSSHNPATIKSIEDMQRFMEKYPDFKKMSGNVAKHVSVVHELSHIVNASDLIHLSQLEQEIACEDGNYAKKIASVIASSAPQIEKLRLVLLYSLRFPGDMEGVTRLRSLLVGAGIPVDLLDQLREYVNSIGAKQTSGEVSGQNIISIFRKAVGLSGVENVYTQHKSLLYTVLDTLMKGKVKDSSFPVVDSRRRPLVLREKPKRVIAFVVGGATYEEARDVRTINQQCGGGVILGGTTIHNSKSFLADVAQRKSR